jgi:hypothetical protein
VTGRLKPGPVGNPSGMTSSKHWRVEIDIDEHEDQRRTQAVARLQSDDRTDDRTDNDRSGLTGEGVARRNPRDTEIPQIGDELAVARALSDLAHKLLDAAADDIEQSTHRPAHLIG